jgi:beta-phosphoglucomutase-like phosphatase (HAD superfamily)
MTRTPAIVFDMDGVLIDCAELHADAKRIAFAHAPLKTRVTLTIKTEDEKTFKILSRVIEGKQDRTGVVTSVVDGVLYLQEFHTSNAKFILQNGIEGSK